MSKRFLLLAVAILVTASASGCGWRRGCSKCASKVEVLPPAPANYCPAPCP